MRLPQLVAVLATCSTCDGVFWGFTVTPVPEPSTFLLMAGFGALAFAILPRRSSNGSYVRI